MECWLGIVGGQRSLPLPAHLLNGEGLTRWPLIRGSAHRFRMDVAGRSSSLNYSAGSSPAGGRQKTAQKMNFLGTMVWSSRVQGDPREEGLPTLISDRPTELQSLGS